jgi:ubiquinone/menaquinone biosynthesis C-methylase UbiE
MEDAATQLDRWRGMFDAVAPVYDRSGVPFFGPIAAGLVERLAPRPDERAVDLGAGRGAATLPLARAVGERGRVDALDLSPEMAALLRAEAADLPQVRVRVGDASDPPLDRAAYDLVSASLMLFFLPDPVAALRRWLALLVPGGRLGAATFQPWTASWRAVEDVFGEYADPVPGPGPTTMPDAFHSDAGVERLFRDAGVARVRTERATYVVAFRDVGQWREWSLGTAMRGLWLQVPEAAHGQIMERVGRVLAESGGRLDVAVRYTLGSR